MLRLRVSQSYVLVFVFLRLGVSFLPFGGWSVLRLGVRFLTFQGYFTYVWGLVSVTF